MKNKVLPKFLLFTSILSVSSVASAGLIDRGNGMIYDDVLDVTWLQDTNYALTSGYSVVNANSTNEYIPGTTADEYSQQIYANGAMGFNAANTWVDQLNYGGFSDWRLPTVKLNVYGDYPEFSELLYMFKVNLGNTCSDPDDLCTSLNTAFNDISTGKVVNFFNVNNDIAHYVTDTVDPYNYGMVFTYYKETNHNEVSGWGPIGAWAVRDGDVAKVSEPSTIVAMLLGLAGLCVRRKAIK